MQNLIIIHGRPSWSAQFLIGLFNTCGRFTAIRYAMNEARDFCFAYCREIATGERIEGPSVSIAMAKAEGWFDRKGSKWRTMADLMLRNRSAAFLIRTTAPELSLGLPIRDEIEDIIDMDMPEAKPTSLQAVREILAEPDKRAEVVRNVTKDNKLLHRMAEEQSDLEVKRAQAFDEANAQAMPEDIFETPPAPVADEPAKGTTMMEPRDLPGVDSRLPLKDGEREPKDAARVSPKTAPKAAPKPTAETVPKFDADAYAARVSKIGDVDLLVLMREEIVTLPPSVREDMAALIDARIHSLIPKEGEENDHS